MEITRKFVDVLEPRLIEKRSFIQIVLGPRQVGKTTAMHQIERRWKEPVVFASADLPHQLDRNWIRQQWQKARIDDGLLILDEVQKVPDWSTEVKALYDEDRHRQSNLKVILLGSASWLLQQGLNETLAGRFEVIKANHWSYAECRACFGWDFKTFLKYGGYPAAAALIGDAERWQAYIRDSVIEPMLSRDIIPLRNIAKPALFRQTLALSMSYPAQEISLQKMLGQMQEHGNTTTIKGYLELLSAGFVVHLLEKFSTRKLTKKSSSPKILPMCPALIHAYAHPTRIDQDTDWLGRVFEACIGATLVTHFTDVSYWREDHAEVDYVITHEDKILAIEVKSGRKKSAKGLQTFLKHFPEAKPLILDFEMGETLLRSESPRSFILNLL